jgi:hypothetical protein
MKTAEDAEDAEGKRLDEITGAVVDAAMKIHTALGPGLLESVYEKCLKHELSKRGLRVQSQVWLPVAEGCRASAGHPQGSAVVLPETQRQQGRPADQLQRGTSEGRNQTPRQ